MPNYQHWFLPTDDPKIRKHRAEVLDFDIVQTHLPHPVPSPRSTQPDLQVAERHLPDPVEPNTANVRALLENIGATFQPTKRASKNRSRRQLLALFDDLDRLANNLGSQ